MAMQAENAASVLPSAQVVGNAFVEQYYHFLHQSPELVHKFYQDSSILSRPDANGFMSSVTTMQAIDEKIQSLDYKNCKAEIKTTDAQDSHQSGVIVLVTGCLTGKDNNIKRKFAQTFFLAPQEKGYFVQNDVFRYVEESAPLEKVVTSVENIVDHAPADRPIQSSEVTYISDNNPTNEAAPNLTTEDVTIRPEVIDPEDKSGPGLEEEVVDEPAPVQAGSNETSPVQKPDPSATLEEKKSYASIVRVTKITGSTGSGHGQTGSLRGAPANTDHQKSRPAKPSPEPETLAPVVVNGPESNYVHDDGEGHSIYVKNLAMNATVTQLEEVFKKFGPIKTNGIQVRSNKHQGFCFGFVEFESLDSMHSAIKAPSITIGNRQVAVEEKRTTTRVGGVGGGSGGGGGGRGRYSSGRGSGFRGRGGYYGGRSFGRNEFRYQGEYSNRSKGRNSEVYQRVDKNEGGRYTHQPNKDPNSSTQ